MRTCSSYANNDFAKMHSRGHVPVGRVRLIEGEYLIDHRLNAARRYRAARRLKHLHRADRDALHVGATGKDRARIEFSGRTAQAAAPAAAARRTGCSANGASQGDATFRTI